MSAAPEPPALRASEHAATVARLRGCLARADSGELSACLAELHPSDVADAIEALEPPQQLTLLRLVPPKDAALAIAEMDRASRPEALVAALPERDAAALLDELPDDDGADLLGAMAAGDRRRLLAALTSERAAVLRGLLRYPPTSAGGLMTTTAVILTPGMDAAEALAEVRRQGRALEEEFFLAFVVDGEQRLLGTVTLRALVLADDGRGVAELMETPPAVATPELEREQVARLLRHYDLPSVAVVDGSGRLLGRITWDDVMDVLEEEQTEDLLRFSGTDPAEPIRGGWSHAVRSRLPWLFVNLGTGAAAAAVVYLYQDTIDRLVILAVVMPIVAGLGGNAGTQALAVTIRRITLETQSPPGRWRLAGKELLVGMTTGAALGLAVGAAAGLWTGDAAFAFVVLAATWGSVMIASLAGAFVPVLLERAGADPAVASSVFVTTFTDLAGFFLLLRLAAALLL